MRARRGKKISKEQMSREIFEPVIALEYLEKGVLPKDYDLIIRKVERYLNVPLFKTSQSEFDPSLLASESKIPSGLSVNDLRILKERQNRDNLLNKEVNPEELDKEKIDELLGTPEGSEEKKKKGFFKRLFGSKKKESKEKIEEESEKEED